MREIPEAVWPRVRDIMTPRDRLATLPLDASAERALEELGRRDVRQVSVLDGAHLEGIVRRRDLALAGVPRTWIASVAVGGACKGDARRWHAASPVGSESSGKPQAVRLRAFSRYGRRYLRHCSSRLQVRHDLEPGVFIDGFSREHVLGGAQISGTFDTHLELAQVDEFVVKGQLCRCLSCIYTCGFVIAEYAQDLVARDGWQVLHAHWAPVMFAS